MIFIFGFIILVTTLARCQNLGINDGQKMDLVTFPRFAEVNEYLETLLLTNQNVMQVIPVNTTEESRPLQIVKISTTNFEDTTKPLFVIEAGINPREWISIVTALNVITNLVRGGNMLSSVDWIVIPVLNPDGYEYTHTNLRQWEKSRSANSHLDLICPGVNLNRNFDIDWQNHDSSSSPCSHIYAGVYPFSEIETQSIKNLLTEYVGREITYISIQNKGEYVSYPWSYQETVVDDQLVQVADRMAYAMGESYTAGPASSIFGLVSGSSMDYVYANGAKYVFTIDIALSTLEQEIEEDEIRGVANNVWNAIATLANIAYDVDISRADVFSLNTRLVIGVLIFYYLGHSYL